MRREWSVAIAIALLAVVLGFAAPSYFSAENVRDLFLVNLSVLVVATGATLVILSGEIDISVGSAFAVCSVVAGIAAGAGAPVAAAGAAACAAGAALGALNGALVAFARIPSIVVTLAAMVALRDGLRWATGGAWIENLPPQFQWLGLSQTSFPVATGAGVATLVGMIAWTMRNVAAGRAVYATGSNAEAARLASIDTALVKLAVFTGAGALTGLAALLNSVRFNQIPSNTGLGLEMKVIAAVVVGGAAITGGRGTFTGTVLGVVLLGAVGPALTFLGVSAQWERALQGAIILAAVTIDKRPS
jgi:rhamnose transport system permease protein